MSPRCLTALSLFAPLYLCGCGAVSQVRTAFEMPVAPTPSPRELARARETKAFDSLSKSVAKLNSDTIRQIFGTKASTAPTTARQPLRPSPLAVQPALLLVGDLRQGANAPVTSSPVVVSLAGVRPGQNILLPNLGSNTTRTIATRSLFSSGLSPVDGSQNASAQGFLESWAARESLRRADDALLGRRNLEDRIAFESRLDLPALNLSLVSSETQLELTNLRLKLLPLLQVPRAQRAQAVAEIEAIEARLNQIWEQETARQAALFRQSLVEVPARLRREGESVLEEQTRQSASRTQARLAQVRRDLEARLRLPGAPALSLVQRATTSPNSATVRAQVSAPLGGSSGNQPVVPITVSNGNTIIARRTGNVPTRVAETVAAKNERIWSAALR